MIIDKSAIHQLSDDNTHFVYVTIRNMYVKIG